jgi:hypothetical protein
MSRRARDEDRGSALIALQDLLRRVLSSADFEKARELLRAVDPANDEPDEDDFDPTSGRRLRPPTANDHRFAMDSTSPGRFMADREMAIAMCEPVTGRAALMACDGPAAIFRTALRQLGVDTNGVHPSGLPAIFRIARRAQIGGAQPAMSERDHQRFVARHPEAARIRVI